MKHISLRYVAGTSLCIGHQHFTSSSLCMCSPICRYSSGRFKYSSFGSVLHFHFCSPITVKSRSVSGVFSAMKRLKSDNPVHSYKTLHWFESLTVFLVRSTITSSLLSVVLGYPEFSYYLQISNVFMLSGFSYELRRKRSHNILEKPEVVLKRQRNNREEIHILMNCTKIYWKI